MVQTVELNEFSGGIPTAAKVLIVDDEYDIVEEVVEHLEDEGLECVPAHNAAEAMDLVKNDPEIGIVVTDIRMPGMDGLEMARELDKEYGETRDLFVIVVTGHAGMKEAIEALQLGAEDFLTKPISPDHLLHSVRRAGKMISLRANERFYQDHLEREVRERTAEVRQLADDLEKRNKELSVKNQELTVVNQLKDEFMQMMSHELNTPLNAIMGFSQLLMDNSRRGDSQQCEKCADHIHSAGMRLTKTVDSILTLSSMMAGDLRPDCSIFTSRDFVDSVVSDYVQRMDSLNAVLHSDGPDQPFDISADFTLLHKAVGHLLENAATFGGEGGGVSISISKEDDLARIAVADEGPGMTEEQIAIAMEPMRQIDGSIGRKFEGMGLGLPLVRGIAEMHGGMLEIDSTPGEGTKATIIVPVDNKS